MNTRLCARSIVVIALGLMAIAGVFVALQQTQNVWAGRSLAATAYTVGGPCGATIQACINNPIVVNGDHILIPAGIYNESLTLNKAVSLIGTDADTTIVHALSGQRVMTVTGNTITATTIISGLTITGGGEGANGGGIHITGGAQPLIQDMIIANNLAYHGGGIYADAGSPLTLLNTQLLSNTAPGGFGGGAAFQDAAVLIDGRFENNEADGGGGVWGASALTLTNVVFFGNTAAIGSGGGALAWTVNAVGGRFENNAANTYGSGGGVYANTLSIAGTSFISNTAHLQYGGGAFAYEKATVLNGYFENNRAVEGSGGGLAGNNLTLINTTFVSNTALPDAIGGNGWGGGVMGGTATLMGNYFEHNEAVLGGGLFANGVQSLVATQFISNIAHAAGGGLYSIDILNVTDTVFMGNSAIDGGGWFHADWYGASPSARIVNSIFARNVASGNGAGMYLSSPGQATILNTTIADVGLNPKQAIVIFSGTVGITNTIITSHAIGISQTVGTGYENYNLFFGNTNNKRGTIGGGANDVIGDPRYADPIGGDYHIITGSAAIGAGVNAGVWVDIDNQPRPANRIDMGADEFWAPGALKYAYLPLLRKN